MLKCIPGITLLARAVALIGCGQQKSPEIKIGHVGPLTGSIAHLGKDNENGARLAIEEANAAGIKIGGKDAKFTLVAEDDQADPKVGTTVAQKLADAKVAGVVGHLNRAPRFRLRDLQPGRLPVISGSATNPKLTDRASRRSPRCRA